MSSRGVDEIPSEDITYDTGRWVCRWSPSPGSKGPTILWTSTYDRLLRMRPFTGPTCLDGPLSDVGNGSSNLVPLPHPLFSGLGSGGKWRWNFPVDGRSRGTPSPTLETTLTSRQWDRPVRTVEVGECPRPGLPWRVPWRNWSLLIPSKELIYEKVPCIAETFKM